MTLPEHVAQLLDEAETLDIALEDAAPSEDLALRLILALRHAVWHLGQLAGEYEAELVASMRRQRAAAAAQRRRGRRRGWNDAMFNGRARPGQRT